MSDRLPLVVANLKANLNLEDITSWLAAVGPHSKDFPGTIIFSPSYPFLAAAGQEIKKNNFNIKLASQDISKFTEGAHTGEVSASQIKDIVPYTLIGHSERRDSFRESEDDLTAKVENATDANIEPIFCVQGENTNIPQAVKIVAYEPVFAIGTNNPQDPTETVKVISKIKSRGDYLVLYGGSVSGDNAKSYVESASANGLLVGATNSLDPQNFIAILKALS